MDKLTINGYKFQNSVDAKLALKEHEAIKKIQSSVDVSDTEGLYTMYNKMTSKNYFSTPVGIGFLHEMRDYLMQFYSEEQLNPINVLDKRKKKEDTGNLELNFKQLEKLKKENERLNIIKQRLVVAVVAMAVVIVGMFFIVVTNDNLGYFNAEEKVLNKYAAWQERLESWENELIEREHNLEE